MPPRVRRGQVPRVYGDVSRFRRYLRQSLQRGGDLLDEAQGIRAREANLEKVKNETERLVRRSLAEFAADYEWYDRVARWNGNVERALHRHLVTAAREAAPAVLLPSPKRGELEAWEGWLRAQLEDVRRLLDRLGASRDVQRLIPIKVRLDELRASGLVEVQVVDDYVRTMEHMRTPKQLRDCIGAAKEVVEATLRGALERLGERWEKRDDLPALMKKWRRAVRADAAPDAEGRDALEGALVGLTTVVTFVGEARSGYGSGNGRTRYPAGLKPRHARLAVDCAETIVRFVVVTLDDLELLPPE